MKTIRKDVASPLPILLFLPVQELNRSARELSTRTPRSTGLILANDSGQARAEDPRIRRMLDMLEPMMLPRARAPYFFAAATTQVTSSGNDVPPARIVMAMNFSDRPEFSAIRQAESTRMSPPNIKAAIPTTTIRIENQSFLAVSGCPSPSSAFPPLMEKIR